MFTPVHYLLLQDLISAITFNFYFSSLLSVNLAKLWEYLLEIHIVLATNSLSLKLWFAKKEILIFGNKGISKNVNVLIDNNNDVFLT